jgi:hypothetical protein
MTTASPGDIEFKTFSIKTQKGNLDLLDSKKAKKLEFNVYYDILSPVVAADIEVLDENDALGTYNITAHQDVNIKFTVPGGETVSLTLETFDNADLSDNTAENKGAMKHKTYTIKMIGKEINKNVSSHIQKCEDPNTPSSTIVKNAMKEISDKEVDTPDPTIPHYIPMNAQTVFRFIERIREQHVSQQYKSSAYVLFPTYEGGTEKYKFCTFEYLMTQGSKFEFKQDNTVGSRTTTDGDQMHNLIWIDVPSSFNSAELAKSAKAMNNYNIQTGKQNTIDPQKQEFKTLGTYDSWRAQLNEIDNQDKNTKPKVGADGGSVGYINVAMDKNKTQLAQAQAARARFLALLAQNTVKFEIHGNPAIKIGDVVTLKIPKKADAGQDDGETQINDKVLIVRIRHRILPEGNKPRYTMIVEAVKAGYNK